MAVTGPFEKLVTSQRGSFGSKRYQKWYRQSPIRTPNPYIHKYGEAYGTNLSGNRFDLPTNFPRSWAGDWVWRQNTLVDMPVLTEMQTRAQARAYASFEGEIRGPTSAVGVNIAERSQAVYMIGNRVNQLLSAWRQFRKGNIRNGVSLLGLQRRGVKNPVGKPTVKEAANLWLEYWFGWSPLVEDAHNAVGVITRTYYTRAEGAGKEVAVYSRDLNYGAYNVMQPVGQMTVDTRCKIKSSVIISNPSYFLASQLGLTSPLTVVWELIPFSFLVDWIANVQTWISSDLHHVGLGFPDATTTYKERAMSSVALRTPRLNGKVDTIYPTSLTTARAFERRLGFTTPELVLSIPNKWSWQRAATAVSLLAQAWR